MVYIRLENYLGKLEENIIISLGKLECYVKNLFKNNKKEEKPILQNKQMSKLEMILSLPDGEEKLNSLADYIRSFTLDIFEELKIDSYGKPIKVRDKVYAQFADRHSLALARRLLGYQEIDPQNIMFIPRKVYNPNAKKQKDYSSSGKK